MKSKLFLACLLASTQAHSSDFKSADFKGCESMFLNQKPPTMRPELPRALCYQSFAVMHSGKTKTPVWVAQRLNRVMVESQIERSTKFFPDARLPSKERAELDDYKHSGYDRGHLASAADQPDETSMEQSFSLANIVPQTPINNRKLWSKIEKDTRGYIMKAEGDVYVITGVVFAKNYPTIGNGVGVPSHLFKLVVDAGSTRTDAGRRGDAKSGQKTWAHWLENSDSAVVSKPITYEDLTSKLGYNLIVR